MSTIEVRLPYFVERGASGGLRFNTTVRPRYSGFESRIQNWADSRGEWDISFGAHHLYDDALINYLSPVLDLFGSAFGRLHSWRFKDWTDYQIPPNFSADEKQQIALGDGSTTLFRIIRTYQANSAFQYDRKIDKIVSATDRLWIEAAEKTRVASAPAAGEYSIDITTGKVTTGDTPAATGGSGPGGEEIVYMQCEFDCHVRFGVDHLQISAISAESGFVAASIPRIPIIEVKPAA